MGEVNNDVAVTIDWIDGPHTFALPWGELKLLEAERDAGSPVIYARLLSATWRVDDISATIRWGLVGAGMKPDEALKLVRARVESRPPFESLPLAQGILGAGLQGYGDPLGEAAGEAAKGSTTSPTDASDQAESTAEASK